MAIYDGWETLRDDKDPQRDRTLGRPSGQGTVYLARSPERVKQIRQNADELKKLLRDAMDNVYHKDLSVSAFCDLARKIVETGGPDRTEHLGALKCYKISTDDKAEEARAVARLESEIRALKKVKHPAVLKLLHENARARLIVTQYHRRGSLGDNLRLYRGDALAALKAFRLLVDGVVAVHQHAIHRDIKPANIFIADSGDLVLGDFGIVFFDTGTERVTRTIGELVGSHWWMPPWAYAYDRIAVDKVNYSFDV